MILGIFLALGDSFSDMAKTGQDIRFKKFYLNFYARKFKKVYVFTYANEKPQGIPNNVEIIPNKYGLHRYLYGFLIPFLNISYILKCDIFRIFHLSGTIPGIVISVFYQKPFVFNYAYDYEKVTQIEGQKFQNLLYKTLKPIAFFFSSKIFVASKYLLRSIPQSKSIYLPNGVDTNFFKPKKRSRNGKPVILSVGRLERQKKS